MLTIPKNVDFETYKKQIENWVSLVKKRSESLDLKDDLDPLMMHSNNRDRRKIDNQLKATILTATNAGFDIFEFAPQFFPFLLKVDFKTYLVKYLVSFETDEELTQDLADYLDSGEIDLSSKKGTEEFLSLTSRIRSSNIPTRDKRNLIKILLSMKEEVSFGLLSRVVSKEKLIETVEYLLEVRRTIKIEEYNLTPGRQENGVIVLKHFTNPKNKAAFKHLKDGKLSFSYPKIDNYITEANDPLFAKGLLLKLLDEGNLAKQAAIAAKELSEMIQSSSKDERLKFFFNPYLNFTALLKKHGSHKDATTTIRAIIDLLAYVDDPILVEAIGAQLNTIIGNDQALKNFLKVSDVFNFIDHDFILQRLKGMMPIFEKMDLAFLAERILVTFLYDYNFYNNNLLKIDKIEEIAALAKYTSDPDDWLRSRLKRLDATRRNFLHKKPFISSIFNSNKYPFQKLLKEIENELLF